MSILALVAGLFSTGATLFFDQAAPAAAAIAPSQQWVTAIADTPGEAAGQSRTLTFGSSGVSAVERTASSVGTCYINGSGDPAGANLNTFWEPDANPATSQWANSLCSRDGSRTSTVEFSDPVLDPIIHVYNLDASRVSIGGTDTAGNQISLTSIVKNSALDVTGRTLNNAIEPADRDGCEAADGTNPNGACGSFRLTSAAPIKSLTMVNQATPGISGASGFNDSWAWTLSFPTAPLTKVFEPTAIKAGGTSELTFSITNPAESTAVAMGPLGFTDAFPDGLTVANGDVTDNGRCGTFSATDASGNALRAGSTSLGAANIDIAPGAVCEITVAVTAPVGSYTNTTDNLSASVANLIPDADTTLTVTDQLSPFSCVSNAPGYLFQGAPTDVFQVDMATAGVTEVGTDIDPDNINGVGYNPLDNYIYGMAGVGGTTNAGFVRVGSTYLTDDLGLPSNWSTFPGMPAFYANGGVAQTAAFDEEGVYWIAQAQLTTPTPTLHWVAIDMDPSSARFFEVIDAGSTPMFGNVSISDWAYNVDDGNFYGVGYSATDSNRHLVKFDTATQTISSAGRLGTMGAQAYFGAAYSDADGFLYSSNNTDGSLWRVDMSTGDVRSFGTGPASSLNDGARCLSPMALDFGDAPNSFGTDLLSNGPRHSIVEGTQLGATIDKETDGQPSAAANGDGADEDGVTFNSALGYANPTLRTGIDPTSQQPVTNTLDVEASANGFVSAWVDWNQDGDFLDANEQVANGQAVTTGTNQVTFAQGTNPAGIQTFVRVRYSTDASAITAPTGAAPDGEVEDYRVLIERLVQPDSCTTSGVDHYSFTFGAPVNLTGTGAVGSKATYRNVTVVRGVAVDMVAELIAGVNYTGQLPPNGFGGGGVAADAGWQIRQDATIRYSFYEAGTTTPIAVNAVFTLNDMDSSETAAEKGTFSADDLAGYAVTQGSAVTVTESGGKVTFTGSGNQSGGPESRFQVVLEGLDTFDARWQGNAGSGFLMDGNGDLSIDPPACEDFGDAPDTYGTDLGNNGPRHTIVPGLLIGSKIDFDMDGQPSPGADGDDKNRLDDEDAFADTVVLNPGATSTTLTVPVTNTTGTGATLYGWIDSNDNGRFEASEFASILVPTGATSVDLAFVGIPPAVDGRQPAMRLRLTTDTLADSAGTIGVDERSLGAATNGEVEDHLVRIATPVPISCSTPFVETFGAGAGFGPALPAGQTTYTYVGAPEPDGMMDDGDYALLTTPRAGHGAWLNGEDHTPGDANGRMMVVNADFSPKTFFQRTFTGLSLGAPYEFSAWIANALNSSGSILPDVTFNVRNADTGEVLATGSTGGIAMASTLKWQRNALQFKADSSTVLLELVNNAPGGGGNDLAIDDISFSPACEFGDAPATYGTLAVNDGAAHITTGPTLGTQRDSELNGQPNAAADGDDKAGTPDDEDGVTTAITATVGRASTVTISATNNSDVAVTLAGWLDLDGNGRFDPAERVLATIPANTGTANHELSFPGASTTTNTYARFRIYGGEVADPSPTGTAAAGEVEDYLVTVLTPATLQVQKVGEDSNADIVPMDGSQWAVYDAVAGGSTVISRIAAATDTDGDPVTGLFRDTTLTEGSYWLEETRALDGFELLAQRVPFTVTADGTVALGAGAGSNITVIDLDGVATIRVEDAPKLDLPDAGGPGTALIYLLGAAMLGAAGAISAVAAVRRRVAFPRRLARK